MSTVKIVENQLYCLVWKAALESQQRMLIEIKKKLH